MYGLAVIASVARLKICQILMRIGPAEHFHIKWVKVLWDSGRGHAGYVCSF